MSMIVASTFVVFNVNSMRLGRMPMSFSSV